MATAIESGVDLPKAIGDIERLEGQFDAFQKALQVELDRAVKETAEEFRDEVKQNIKGSRIEEDTGELLNSWVVRPKGIASYEVRSTADHAIFLEVGTEAHEITGDPSLIFKAEPGTYEAYPDEVKRGDGWVEMRKVEHPGNDAYRYFEAAIRSGSWPTKLNNRVRTAVDNALEEVGL